MSALFTDILEENILHVLQSEKQQMETKLKKEQITLEPNSSSNGTSYFQK
jgi:hypothetical protein